MEHNKFTKIKHHQENNERVFNLDEEGTELRYLLAGYRVRATSARLNLIELLLDEKKPLSAADISKKMENVCDTATTYRALDALVKAKLINRLEIGRDAAYFEIAIWRKHHHHMVCTSCGDMEDVEGCFSDEIHKIAETSKLKKFKRVDRHALEFFGLCTRCDSIKK
jgi:Fur family ferric uptake transcriptional regulator